MSNNSQDNRDQKTGRTAQASPEGVPCGGVSRQDEVALLHWLKTEAELSDHSADRYRAGSAHCLLYRDRAKQFRAAAAALAPPPTHRHVKRGSAYRFIGAAKLQSSIPLSDMDAMVVYQAEDGTLWVRPHIEFFDGRFEPIEAA